MFGREALRRKVDGIGESLVEAREALEKRLGVLEGVLRESHYRCERCDKWKPKALKGWRVRTKLVGENGGIWIWDWDWDTKHYTCPDCMAELKPVDGAKKKRK